MFSFHISNFFSLVFKDITRNSVAFSSTNSDYTILSVYNILSTKLFSRKFVFTLQCEKKEVKQYCIIMPSFFRKCIQSLTRNSQQTSLKKHSCFISFLYSHRSIHWSKLHLIKLTTIIYWEFLERRRWKRCFAAGREDGHKTKARRDPKQLLIIIEPLVLIEYFWFGPGLLSKSHRDKARLCRRMEQPRLRVQCTGWNMAGHSPLREGSGTWSKLLGRLHQSRQRTEGSEDFRQVSSDLTLLGE